MKRLSYAELAERVEEFREESLLSHVALSLVHNTKPAAVERVKGDSPGQRYVLELYGADRASGGIVIVTFHCRGQSPTTSAYYLEKLKYPLHAVDLRNAVDRLTIARNRLLQAAA